MKLKFSQVARAYVLVVVKPVDTTTADSFSSDPTLTVILTPASLGSPTNPAYQELNVPPITERGHDAVAEHVGLPSCHKNPKSIFTQPGTLGTIHVATRRMRPGVAVDRPPLRHDQPACAAPAEPDGHHRSMPG
jgi:hypothetical protein